MDTSKRNPHRQVVLADTDETPYAGIVPGAGWLLTYDVDDARVTVPIVAWGVDADGWGDPLVPDVDGALMPVDSTFTRARVHHPDEHEHLVGDAA